MPEAQSCCLSFQIAVSNLPVSLRFEKFISRGAQFRRIVRDDGVQAERGRASEPRWMINRPDDCLQPARGFDRAA
jgi:hypothetical protein